ncbi:hypothetical protein [Amnibacterium kyonggiense]|uniref:Uncharacterized protein n=1 Tax=Amnibacterium kyonggiense TaxID=595671 RepID=A0A4R7FJB7_9MICO|nr:hypothetical protein [Amnibacterium kyonggiense]TDS76146.1 hypothetical protein CLV52_3266 [Amnibacterium kyonggiense]
MTDPTDEDALSWDGDDALAAPKRPAPLIDDRPAGAGRASGGGFSLLVLGVLGGVAVLETAFWIRSAFDLQIAASVSTGGGTPVELIAFVLNVAGRVLAVLAPVVWFVLVLWRVRVPSRRLALLALGALLLVPWPAILVAA